MTVDLSSARAKRERASEHRTALSAYVDHVLNDPNHSVSLGATYDTGSDRHTVYVTTAPDMTDALQRTSLMVGDIVHNLRSALDHAAWQLASRHAPISKDDERFVKFRLCTHLNGGHRTQPIFLSAEDWTFLHEWQECRGANGRPDNYSGDYIHQLTLLANLNNDDKHKVLTALDLRPNALALLAPSLAPSLDSWPDDRHLVEAIEWWPSRWAEGAPLMSLYAPLWTKGDIADVGTAKGSLALVDGGRVAMPTLQRLDEYVGSVLDSLGGHFAT